MKTNKEYTDQFASLMENELNANSHKGDWKTWWNVEEQMQEALYHHEKLESALCKNDIYAIREYSADCANFYLMIANTTGALFNDNDHPGQLKLW